MDFKPLKNTKLYMLVVEEILRMVRAGSLKPGDRLPAERDLSERWRIGRPAIREGFSVLELLGVVEARPGQGTFIRAVDEGTPHAALLSLGVGESPFEILEARRALECETAYLAAERARPAEIDDMQRALSAMEDEFARRQVFSMEHDREFHQRIAAASHSSLLARLARSVLDLTQQQLWLTMRDRSHAEPQRPGRYLREHRGILDAIARRQPEAARARMAEHLRGVMVDTFGYNGGPESPLPPEPGPPSEPPAPG
jgi:GntR family transcriptional repressor for pyruvate dehydrogenase complex